LTAKARLLELVRERGSIDSEEVAEALGYTVPGAGSMLLRLHRHGHLRRRREGQVFFYTLSPKGESFLAFRLPRARTG